MKWETLIFVDLLGATALLMIVQLLRKQRLTIGLGVVWFSTICMLMCIATIAPLRRACAALSIFFFSSPPYLVALTIFLLFFLIYVSMVISKLQRQIIEMAQYIAMGQTNKEPE